MKKNIILIDFENVQPITFTTLPENFRVIVFIGSNQAKIPFEFAYAMQEMATNAKYVKISGQGKNALDFHIAFYIGKLIEEDKNTNFHIISKDTGFDPLIEHLKSQKISANRLSSIEEIPILRINLTKSITEKAELYMERFKKENTSKPRTIQTLGNSIKSYFQQQLNDKDIIEIIKNMQTKGFIKISEDKILYSA